jgi:Replication factor-A protein 1, N-terminal domain
MQSFPAEQDSLNAAQSSYGSFYQGQSKPHASVPYQGQLTPGAIKAIKDGNGNDVGDCDLQVVNIRQIGLGGQAGDRYRLILSDGKLPNSAHTGQPASTLHIGTSCIPSAVLLATSGILPVSAFTLAIFREVLSTRHAL